MSYRSARPLPLGLRLRDVSQATTGVEDLELALRRSQERPNLEIEPALYVVGVAFVVVVAGVHPTTAIVATPKFVKHVTSSRSASTSSSRRIAWAIAMARRQSDERYSRVRAAAGGASRVEGEAGTGCELHHQAAVDLGGTRLSIERGPIHGEGNGSIRRGRRRPAVVGEPHGGAFF